MMIVTGDRPTVERLLAQRRLLCPGCRRPLRAWGWARPRRIRLAGNGHRLLRPRRARCSSCAGTHVLLPPWVLARRADAAPLIWTALTASAAGWGYRRTAHKVRRPLTTVRGWIRGFRRGLPAILGRPEVARRRDRRQEPALAAIAALEAAAPPLPAWQFAVVVSRGLLLCNTNAP